MNSRVAVYRVSFRDKDVVTASVTNRKGNDFSEPCVYIDSTDLLITEDEIDIYRQFGGGFKTLEYVGVLQTGIRNDIEESIKRKEKSTKTVSFGISTEQSRKF